MDSYLNENISQTDETKIQKPEIHMTDVEALDNEIKQLKSKKTKKRRPSPSLISKITGIEISFAPNKSFRKKFKKDETEIDLSRRPNLLYEAITEPKPANAWVTSRIAYDIDNEDDEDSYYPPVVYEETNSLSNNAFENKTQQILDTDYSNNKKEDPEDKKPRTRKNRVNEIANQWSSLIMEKPTNLKKKSDKFNYYDEFGDKNQVTSNHRHIAPSHKYQNKHHHKRGKSYNGDIKSNENGYIRRHQLSTLNTGIQTDEFTFVESGSQTLSEDLDIFTFKLGSATKYQTSSKHFKSKAAVASNSREKILFLFEASLNSLLESFAFESYTKDLTAISKKFLDTLNFTKNNGLFISQNLSKVDEDSFWSILSVLNIQMGAYIYNKLYMLRRSEISGAKTIIDNFFMKNGTSPSLCSSPNTSIESNEDSKLRDKLSEKMMTCVQFYTTQMEHLAKWHSYMERANNIIAQNNLVSTFFQSLNLLTSQTLCEGSIQSFFNYINEAYHKICSLK